MAFHFGSRSLRALQGVHPDLVQVAERALAISPVDFTVIQGLRTREQQRRAVASGNSWTMHSRHLTGHAIDVVPWVDGRIDWMDLQKFDQLHKAFFAAAKELGVPLRWGGDWNENGNYHDELRRGSYDGGHFELPRADYPDDDHRSHITSAVRS